MKKPTSSVGALTLTRRLGESIVLTDPSNNRVITIKVMRLERGEVRLAFFADKEVEIYRSELMNEKTGTKAHEP